MADSDQELRKPSRLRSAAAALLVIHAVMLVTWVTIRVFGPNPPEISGGTASALAAVYGLPALSFGIREAQRYARSRRGTR